MTKFTLPIPKLLLADEKGQIYEHPDLLMLTRKGDVWATPKPSELILLPDDSELFLLPKRHAVGLNEESGEVEVQEDLAVAAFISPAHTLSAHPVYVSDEDAPMLPLFAYGAVGIIGDNFYVCAKRVDKDTRQEFCDVPQEKILKEAKALMKAYPKNRLMQHLMANCVMRYSCPAARNLCLGRYEAPIPVSKSCNARCIGCISAQDDGSKICATPQNRMSFTPSSSEIVEVMLHHGKKESEQPIFSFGQGCEGEPLTEAKLIADAISTFRAKGGVGTVNINSNASLPEAFEMVAKSGLSSLRVSINSARETVYNAYYRPKGYTLNDVKRTMQVARENNIFISLNLLYFPGITDTEDEYSALESLVNDYGVSLIQLRNLNIDPEYYPSLFENINFGPSMGLENFYKRLLKSCPNLSFGYFNPYLDNN